jgi:hypothetical protein
VAAWISADTGVDLPSHLATRHAGELCALAHGAAEDQQHRGRDVSLVDVCRILEDGELRKTTVPAHAQTIRMPSMKPKSPIRFVINALLAAAAALSRVNQWPMSK